jgi:hypothetical protein
MGKMNVYRILVGKPEGKVLLGERNRKLEDNIKIDLGIGWEDVSLIQVAVFCVVSPCSYVVGTIFRRTLLPPSSATWSFIAVDSFGSGQVPVEDSLEHGSETLCSISGKQFLDHVKDYQLLKKDCALFS